MCQLHQGIRLKQRRRNAPERVQVEIILGSAKGQELVFVAVMY